MNWDTYAHIAPKPAAAGILITAAEEPQILLGQRNKALRFMGGHHVFPGGRQEESDDPSLVLDAPDEDTARAIMAAAREVFEETGLLCSHRVRPDLGTLRAARTALLAGEITFGDFLRKHHITLRAGEFIPAGVWVTPPFSPVRFDTRYFMHVYNGPHEEEVASADGEITALDWLTAAEARHRWHLGEIHLSTPVAYVLQHLEAFAIDAALPWLHQVHDHKEIAAHRFEMRRGIHLIPLPTPTLPPASHTNCVVIGERELYVVDPGPVEEHGRARLRKHLEHLHRLGGRVAAVLLTHSHLDHVGAALDLREHFGAPIWAHAETARQVPFDVDRLLAHDELIEIAGDPGWRLRCIHTPGHDPGHLAYFEESTRTLMIGDLIANPGTIIISAELEGNMDDYLRSLESLAKVPAAFTIPGHGLPLGKEAGREKIQEIIQHRLAREGKIRAALDGGATTLQALLAEAYADTPAELWPLAEHQLQAHLVRLGVSL
jgi:ribonuclease/clavin/mitogillin